MVRSLQSASSMEVMLGLGVKALWHQLLVWSSEFGTVVVAILFFGGFFGGGREESEVNIFGQEGEYPHLI